MPGAGTTTLPAGLDVRGRHAELAAALVALHDRALELERSAEQLGGRRDVALPSAASGCGTRRRGCRRAPRAARPRSRTPAWLSSSSASPRAPWPKRKFSPTLTWRASSVLDEHVVAEVLRLELRELLRERDQQQLVDAEPGDQLGLHRRMSSGARAGRPAAAPRADADRSVTTHDRRVVGTAPGERALDHPAVAEVDAVEGPDGHAPVPCGAAGTSSRERKTVHQRREHGHGLERAVAALRHRDQLAVGGQPDRALSRLPRRPRHGVAVPRARAPRRSRAGARAGRRERSRAGSSRCSSAWSSRKGPIAVRSSSSQYAPAPQMLPEIGDELAHVGAARAVDLELGDLARLVEPQQLEPVECRRRARASRTARRACALR